MVTDPQKFAAAEDTGMLVDLWVKHNWAKVVDFARWNCRDSAVDHFHGMASNAKEGSRYAIDEIVEHYANDPDLKPLDELQYYAGSHPEYTAPGLRKPRQRKVKQRWSPEPYLEGPTAEEWRQMSTADKLYEVRPTKGVLRWAEQEWLRVLRERVESGDPDLLDHDAQLAYAERICGDHSDESVVETYLEEPESVMDRGWKDDVAQYLADMSDEEALRLGNHGRSPAAQRLPSGAWYWREEY